MHLPRLTRPCDQTHSLNLVVLDIVHSRAQGMIHLDDGGLHTSAAAADIAFDVGLTLSAPATSATALLTIHATATGAGGATLPLSEAVARQRAGDPDWSTVPLERVVYLGAERAPIEVMLNGATLDPSRYNYDATTGAVTVQVSMTMLGEEGVVVKWRWW